MSSSKSPSAASPPAASPPAATAAASSSASAGAAGAAAEVFPVGPAGKRELRRELVRSTDPARTIGDFRKKHSLHSMMARAFGTLPRHEFRVTRSKSSTTSSTTLSNNAKSSKPPSEAAKKAKESLDTDSVMTFLSHLGVSQYEAHRRVSDALLRQLEDEIRKSSSSSANKDKLLQLLKSCWAYAATMPELRPVLWSVLKTLGSETPLPVLLALGERDATTTTTTTDAAAAGETSESASGGGGGDGASGFASAAKQKLKHAEIWEPLSPFLKRLAWEADWDNLVTPLDVLTATADPPASSSSSFSENDKLYSHAVRSTLLYDTLTPLVELYCKGDAKLVAEANRTFVATVRERRVLTKQRRALTALGSAAAAAASAGVVATTAGLLQQQAGTGATASPEKAAGGTGGGAAAAASSAITSGKAVSQIRILLSDTGTGSTASSTFRPKLLYALLSMVMTRHGSSSSTANGSDHLHCTLVADVLLSSGGPLPKAYQYVLLLARLLDDCVAEGNVSNESLSRIQSALRQIFQPDVDNSAQAAAPAKSSKTDSSISIKLQKKISEEAEAARLHSNSFQRQLNRIITAGLEEMKESDPQNLFRNPVTDEIAPGYSKIIKKPMSIVNMEEKVESDDYASVNDWYDDVKLMFKNCIDYNQGKAGQWFRGEAKRQKKAFDDEILPRARKLYQAEIAVRKKKPDLGVVNAIGKDKGDVDGEKKRGLDIAPLPVTVKKRKKEKEEYVPSMPALASILLADPVGLLLGTMDPVTILAFVLYSPASLFSPLSHDYTSQFVVRVFLARVLRELRRGVINGTSLPAAHSVIPSLLQLLHMGRWSRQVCLVRGRKFIIPDGGILDVDVNDPVPFSTLRRYVPLLLRLLMETELDKRMAVGGDLHEAAATQKAPDRLGADAWVIAGNKSYELQVAASLVEAALIFISQPGMGNEASLAATFPKFSAALQSLSPSLCQDRPFFVCLVQVLLRHRQKLPRPSRDAILKCWLEWLKHNAATSRKKKKSGDASVGSITSPAHEYIIRMLNEWSTLGNLLLPRDDLFRFSLEVVRATETSAGSDDMAFAKLWKDGDDKKDAVSDFAAIKQQYERMLKVLPAAKAEEWKHEVGIAEAATTTSKDVQPMDAEETRD